MSSLNQQKVAPESSWGASAKETVGLNFLCGFLLRMLERKGWLEKSNKLPGGVVISKEKLSDDRCPSFIEINFRGNMDYFFAEFGYEQKNVIGVTSEFNLCSPCVVVTGGMHIWLEPDMPKIVVYAGERWKVDAPRFRALVIESGNRGFKYSHLLVPDANLDLKEVMSTVQGVIKRNIDKITAIG